MSCPIGSFGEPFFKFIDQPYAVKLKLGIPNANGMVYDLDVSGTHNFVANGIVTHNSIYKFRGADYRNLMRFEEEFPEASIIVLDQNYRSTQHILDAANAVIANNPGRKEKHLWSDKGFWKNSAVGGLYGWRPMLRLVVGAVALALAVVCVLFPVLNLLVPGRRD